MATPPTIWASPLAAAFLAGFLAVVSAVVTAVLTQRNANHREDVRWTRERDREDARWERERAHEQEIWARDDAARSDERMRQRLADSYLEVLRIIEREGQWVEARITTWKRAGEESEAELGVAFVDAALTGFKGMKVPEPVVTDEATIAAHLAAFGSAKVRKFYRAWRSAITAIETEEAELGWSCQENYPKGPGRGGLTKLLDVLQPAEAAARQAMADAIAEELGHR